MNRQNWHWKLHHIQSDILNHTKNIFIYFHIFYKPIALSTFKPIELPFLLCITTCSTFVFILSPPKFESLKRNLTIPKENKSKGNATKESGLGIQASRYYKRSTPRAYYSSTPVPDILNSLTCIHFPATRNGAAFNQTNY